MIVNFFLILDDLNSRKLGFKQRIERLNKVNHLSSIDVKLTNKPISPDLSKDLGTLISTVDDENFVIIQDVSKLIVFKKGIQVFKTEESKNFIINLKKDEYWDIVNYGNFLIYYIRLEGLYILDITKNELKTEMLLEHIGSNKFSRTIKVSEEEDCILLNRANSAIRIIDVKPDGTHGSIDFELEESKGLINDFQPLTVFLKLENGKVIKDSQIGVIRNNGKLSGYSYDLKSQTGKMVASTIIPLIEERSEQPYTLLTCAKGNLFFIHTVTNTWVASRILVYRYDAVSQFEYLNEIDMLDEGLSYLNSMVGIGYHEDGSFSFCGVTFDPVQPLIMTFNFHMGMNSLDEVTKLRKFFFGDSPFRLVKLGDEIITSDKEGKVAKIRYN